LQAVVLAGGLATRMRPQTLTVPKAMLEVAGRPFVDWQLERLAASGFRDVVMCIAHLGEQIRAHVGDGDRFGLRVRWSDEGPDLLGTAGAIRQALELLAPAFLVTYGDSYLPFDYGEPLRALEASSDCDGVMAVYANAGKWDASNVQIDGAGGAGAPPNNETGGAGAPPNNKTGGAGAPPNNETGGAGAPPNNKTGADATWVLRYEKGSRDPALDHIDYGATALRRDVIAALAPHARAGLDAVQHDLARRKRLRACVARERFFEIGSPEGLAELDRHLRTKAST
jgi:NDP-sugar pyrophosphorylase family protein